MTTTQRLSLLPIRVEHAEVMFGGLCDGQPYTYLPEEPPKSLPELKERYRSLQDARSPDEKEIWLNWIIFKQGNPTPIGYVQATVNVAGTSQIAYLLFAEHWRNGCATEAVSAVLQLVFDRYDTSLIEALIDTRNVASQAVVSKLGFDLVEEIKAADFFKGSSSDEYRYTISREEWTA